MKNTLFLLLLVFSFCREEPKPEAIPNRIDPKRYEIKKIEMIEPEKDYSQAFALEVIKDLESKNLSALEKKFADKITWSLPLYTLEFHRSKLYDGFRTGRGKLHKFLFKKLGGNMEESGFLTHSKAIDNAIHIIYEDSREVYPEDSNISIMIESRRKCHAILIKCNIMMEKCKISHFGQEGIHQTEPVFNRNAKDKNYRCHPINSNDKGRLREIKL